MKYVFIFLNDKLITCDTILPFVIDLKKSNSSLTFKFYTFNVQTLNVIRQNTNLINLINKYGEINVLGWLEKEYPRIVRVLSKIINVLKIILISMLFKSINIHFKGLELFPFNLIFFFNKKNTFLFESNCWGYSINEIEADKVFYGKKKGNYETEFNAYNYLVAFSNDWPQIKFCKKNRKKSYLIPPTKISSNWIEICKNQAKIISKQNPIWMQKDFKSKKKIIYVLGYLGNFPTIDKSYTGESLLCDTLQLILKNTNHIVLLKPHVITDISKLQLIINKFKSNRIFITYNHIAVISHYCSYALGNYFSYALTDAWINGLRVIEYTKYDNKVLDITNGKSLFPKYVDSFINYKPEILIRELNKNYTKSKRTYSSKYNKNYNDLIEAVAK